MYFEMPGLALRAEAAAPLFGVSASVCTAVLNELVRQGLLTVDVKGQYAKSP
jgi:hypothetical protein